MGHLEDIPNSHLKLKFLEKKENIEKIIKRALEDYPRETVAHEEQIWVIDDKIYPRKRITVPIKNAIQIHTHGEKYPPSIGDIDDLIKGLLKKQLIAIITLSPEIKHYFYLALSLRPENKDKMVAFLGLTFSEIKTEIPYVGPTTAIEETEKLRIFAKKYGLDFREGFWNDGKHLI